MKIAIVIERYAPGAGGAERSTAELAGELRSRGHQITILTGSVHAPELKEDEGFSIRVSPFGAPKGISRLLLFRRWVRKQLAAGFDASLSVTSAVPAMVVQPRAGLIRDLQSRSIAWRQGIGSRMLRRGALLLNFRQWTLLWLEGKTLRDPMVRHIACISDMVLRNCAAHHPEVASKLVHVCNAIKPLRFDDEACVKWRSELRLKWGFTEGDTLFFLPSLDSRRKGLTPLLQALAKLRKEPRGGRAFLILSGKVHRSQEKLIGFLGLKRFVRQIGFQSDLRPHYCATDVTVLPTYYDSFGRVVIEALLMGRPAITTAYAGAAELVRPANGPVRGRVVDDPDDIAGLARAMGELCDPDERRRCIAAVGNVLEQHSIQRHVDGLLKLFTSNVPSQGSPK